MNKFSKIVVYLLRLEISIWRTVYFNFRYFSFPVAARFPVLIYRNVRFKKTGGRVIIDSLRVETGMIHIGKEKYGFQGKHDHVIWEQQGGTVIFEKGVSIGKGTFIFVGNNAELRIEENTCFGGNDRIICTKSITVKANTIVAWDVQIIDTDFRATINTVTKTKNCMQKEITIGKNNWLCFGCTVLKGSVTPDNCIVGAKSLVNSDFSCAGENIVIGSENIAKVLARYITWDKLCEL